MKILSNSVRTCIPKSNPLHEFIRNRIVGKRKTCAKNRNYIWEMDHTMWLVICSCQKRNFQVITSENLKRSIDILKTLVFLRVYMNVYIVNISLRDPRISVNDSKINSARIDSPFFKIVLLEMFNTPRHIRSFPLLLMFFNLMPCEAYLSKFCLKLFYK